MGRKVWGYGIARVGDLISTRRAHKLQNPLYGWLANLCMVPFWIPIIVRHLIFRAPKKGP